jgi:MFS transporter, AAHS family, 4-hydroxybenzoate transporter
MLSALRFFTGLGIGGAFPGAATLTGDYAPQRLRATMIMVTFTGAPLGGFVVGQAVLCCWRVSGGRAFSFWAGCCRY